MTDRTIKIMNWFRRIFGREEMCTRKEYLRIHAEVVREQMEEDRLFDEYYKLPDRPRPIIMMRKYEGSEPFPSESFDMEHWKQWRQQRKSEKHT